MLEQLLEKYPEQVNLVFKHYPLPNHKAARPAAHAALAAAYQGKYQELSALLFKNYKKLKNDDIKRYAQQVGLDMTTYERDINSPSIPKIVSEDTRAARQFRIRGVPTLFLNGKKVRNRSFESLEQKLKKELEKTE